MNYRVGNMGGKGWAGWSGVKGGKWDNCNSIISKYIQKNKLKKYIKQPHSAFSCSPPVLSPSPSPVLSHPSLFWEGVVGRGALPSLSALFCAKEGKGEGIIHLSLQFETRTNGEVSVSLTCPATVPQGPAHTGTRPVPL